MGKVCLYFKRLSDLDSSVLEKLVTNSFAEVKRRYEREAIALQHIMPEIHITFGDFLRYFVSALHLDFRVLLRSPSQLGQLSEIVLYRLMQFWGSYRGNHEHRQLSQKRKELYFYPR